MTTLIVDNNELTELPESIVDLSALGLLGASSNHLEELPDEIGSLQSLTILDVSGNRLSELPDLSTLDLLTLGIGGNRLQGSIESTIRGESYTHPHADALPAPYTLIWSNAIESRSWGNQTGDNVVVASTLSAEETTSSGSASTGTSPDGESCGCVSSGGVDRSGLVVLVFLGPLLRRRRRSRSRRVNDA